eukprot:TRINITY_DN6628_c0_g1_i1.p1 TRINITY_DN6628_c0_g1~~TRINITY_DN6628_c0_g1_i1.p1  ORF type:complete len:1343 (+),score=322.31 TRINITY_DN6628_c0_g1_i1:400-4029(+)
MRRKGTKRGTSLGSSSPPPEGPLESADGSWVARGSIQSVPADRAHALREAFDSQSSGGREDDESGTVPLDAAHAVLVAGGLDCTVPEVAAAAQQLRLEGLLSFPAVLRLSQVVAQQMHEVHSSHSGSVCWDFHAPAGVGAATSRQGTDAGEWEHTTVNQSVASHASRTRTAAPSSPLDSPKQSPFAPQAVPDAFMTETRRAVLGRIHNILYGIPSWAPDYVYRRWWDVVVLAAMECLVVVATTQLAMTLDGPSDALYPFEIVVTITLIADICITANTAVLTAHDVLVSDRTNILIHYAKSYLAFDLLSAVPVDRIVWSITSSGFHWRLARTLRLFKAVKYPALMRMTDRGTMDASFVRFYFILKPIVLTVAQILFAAHCLTLGRVLVSPTHSSCDGVSYGLNACTEEPAARYLYAFWWCWAILTTQGIAAVENGRVYVYAAFVALTGLLLQGHVVANLSAFFLKANIKEIQADSMRATFAIMREYRIPGNLQREVLSFQYHSLQQNAAAAFAGVLAYLPGSMQREVGLYVKHNLVARVPMFADLSAQCKLDLANCLEQTFCEPMCYIVEHGEEGGAMYFLMHGFADVIVPVKNERGEEEGRVVATLKRGDFFGEVVLLKPDARRTASVQALTYCDLYELDFSDFRELMDDHAELRARVELEAMVRGLLGDGKRESKGGRRSAGAALCVQPLAPLHPEPEPSRPQGPRGSTWTADPGAHAWDDSDCEGDDDFDCARSEDAMEPIAHPPRKRATLQWAGELEDAPTRGDRRRSRWSRVSQVFGIGQAAGPEDRRRQSQAGPRGSMHGEPVARRGTLRYDNAAPNPFAAALTGRTLLQNSPPPTPTARGRRGSAAESRGSAHHARDSVASTSQQTAPAPGGWFGSRGRLTPGASPPYGGRESAAGSGARGWFSWRPPPAAPAASPPSASAAWQQRAPPTAAEPAEPLALKGTPSTKSLHPVRSEGRPVHSFREHMLLEGPPRLGTFPTPQWEQDMALPGQAQDSGDQLGLSVQRVVSKRASLQTFEGPDWGDDLELLQRTRIDRKTRRDILHRMRHKSCAVSEGSSTASTPRHQDGGTPRAAGREDSRETSEASEDLLQMAVRSSNQFTFLDVRLALAEARTLRRLHVAEMRIKQAVSEHTAHYRRVLGLLLQLMRRLDTNPSGTFSTSGRQQGAKPVRSFGTTRSGVPSIPSVPSVGLGQSVRGNPLLFHM